MLYQTARSLLFKFDAEDAHRLALGSLDFAQWSGVLPLLTSASPNAPVDLLGLRFPNPVGLAAGMDKNGDYIDSLAALGFGFVELGTVTPRPQPGNPHPRLFRVPQASAIINRMGFNNKGVDHLVARLQARREREPKRDCLVAANIGKNFDTPLENAADDYLICMRKVYAYSDYITVNVSSPNTKGLRKLQGENELDQLLHTLKAEQQKLADLHGRYVPFLVKIAPDLEDAAIAGVAELLLHHKIDGVIATNTTLSRTGVAEFTHGNETGGMSGVPLHARAVEVVRLLRHAVGLEYPIIGVGGIMSAASAQSTVDAGANLVQIYSGFVYRGPSLVREIVEQIK